MAIVRSREALVGTRTQLVNHVRGTVKSLGYCLPRCPARCFHKKVVEHIPEALRAALGPILEQIGSLTERIRQYDRQLETICQERYPETDLLRQIVSPPGRSKVVQRRQFVLLVPTALLLGALIALVDSSRGWDDTGVSAAMVRTASGLMGALHPQRAWVWAFAVGSWIPLLGVAFDRFDFASLRGLVFALVGAYAGSLFGKRLTTTANGAA